MEKKTRFQIKVLLVLLGLTLDCLWSGLANLGAQDVVDLGVRRELFLDDRLIDRLDGSQLKLHVPQPREIVLDFKWVTGTEHGKWLCRYTKACGRIMCTRERPCGYTDDRRGRKCN